MSNSIPRAITLITKNKEKYPLHPSQQKIKNIKDSSAAFAGNNFSHPVYQYNNLGVLHLKLKKFNLAFNYFYMVCIDFK